MVPVPPSDADLLAGLDEDQRAAVTSEAGRLAILAGAGSGKTRVLTRRIAHRVATGTADPRHVLAITFTRRAAGELTTRLARMGLRDGCVAGTFHAVAQAQLRRAWADRGTAPRELLDRPARLVASLLGEQRAPAREGLTAAVVAAEIAWAKARLVTPDGYPAAAAAAGRRTGASAERVAELYGRYEQTKRRRRLVDFDDLLVACVAAMARDPAFAEAQRWRFRHLFVDEFQDVNPLQLRLVQAWHGDGGGDLCVVGDPDQAIYGWNGADPTALPRFSDHFPGATSIRLRGNYRSTPQILAVAHAALAANRDAGPPPISHRPDGPVPEVHAFADDAAEAAGVARLLRRAQRTGRSWSSMAVLVRTNAQAAVLAAALAAARIPHRTRGASLLERPAVRAWLRTAARLPTPLALAAALADLDEDLAALRPSTPDGPAGSGGAGPAGPGVAGDASGDGDAAADLAALSTLGHQFVRLDPAGAGTAFVSWLRAAVAGDPAAGGPGVDVVTFHAAKGLEWPVVVVAGMEDGLVPIPQPDAAGRAEEVRLLYVALTRAHEELHLTWAGRRAVGGGPPVPREPSPLLARIEAAASRCKAAASPGDWRDHLARSRAALEGAAPRPRPGPGPGEGADGAARAALDRWRASTARAAGVPPAVVLDDDTLDELARARPRDLAALRAVPGLGPVKATALGPALLDVLAAAAEA